MLNTPIRGLFIAFLFALILSPAPARAESPFCSDPGCKATRQTFQQLCDYIVAEKAAVTHDLCGRLLHADFGAWVRNSGGPPLPGHGHCLRRWPVEETIAAGLLGYGLRNGLFGRHR